MSIIKLYKEGKTDLNKLKFKPTMGANHPGNPPLIQKRVPTENKGTSALTGTQLGKRLDDTGRIAQLFIRKEGLGLLANNTLLSNSVEQSYSVKGSIKDKVQALTSNIGSALLDTLETLGSTLAQVPVTGTGTHFIKGKLFSRPNNELDKRTLATTNLGDPGRIVVRTSNDTLTSIQKEIGKDRVNSREPSNNESKYVEDYIKFQFEVLQPGEDLPSTFIQFRAFLDNFSDAFTSNWNKYNYIGRGESFHTYDSFDRAYNLSFKSAAQTKEELSPIYNKLNYLASTLAPTYNTEIGIQRGTIIRATVGDYLNSVPGFLGSINLSWNNTFSWEIDKEERNLPHILNCDLTFTPIHTFTPQTGKERFFDNYLSSEENVILKNGLEE